jgi:hypothetical protein
VAFAAAHVAADPLAEADPWLDAAVDWDATLAFRRHLWGLGLSIAEAMDTAQRGMGLDWATTQELIKRSLGEAKGVGTLDRIACGAGTDHLAADRSVTLGDVIAAYQEQCEFVEGHGGRIILMASRALNAIARGAEDFAQVYSRVLEQVHQPVILHWLGDMFDPQLSGYWGSADLSVAMEACLGIIRDNAHKIDGIKISLLDDWREITMRRSLPDGVRMYTGDDFNYPNLILGDTERHSDALLGIFDAIAPAATAALSALDNGDIEGYTSIFAPTIPLARHIFRAPTRFYKTGVVFLAYLNGHQRHFHMVGGQQSARSILHLADIFRLADQADLLRDPDLAIARMRPVLAQAGIDA